MKNLSLFMSFVLTLSQSVQAGSQPNKDAYRTEFYAAAMIAEARASGKQQVLAQIVAFAEGVEAHPDRVKDIDHLTTRALEIGRRRHRESRNSRIENMQKILLEDQTGEFFSDLASLAPSAGSPLAVSVKWLDRANRARRFNNLDKLKQPLHEAVGNRIASENEIAEKTPASIHYLLKNSKENPEYLKFLNFVGREIIDVDPTASVQEIAAASNNHMLAQLLKGMIGPDGKVDVNNLNNEMKKALKKVNDTILADLERIKNDERSLAESLKDADQKIASIQDKLEDEVTDQAEVVSRRRQAEELYASFELMALLAPDAEAKSFLRATGSGVMTISESVRRYQIALKNPLNEQGIGTLTMITNVGGAISSILGAIFGAKSADQMILEEIRRTQDMIADLGKYCQQRFDQLGDLVLEVYDQLSAQLRVILQTVEVNKSSLTSLHKKVDDLVEQQLRTQSILQDDIHQLQRKELTEKMSNCFEGSNIRVWGITPDLARQCLDTFFNFALLHSNKGYTKTDFANLVQQVEQFPLGWGAIFPNFIEVMSQRLIRKDTDGKSIRLQLTRNRHNPLEWSIAAQKIVDFSLTHPEASQLVNLEKLDKVVEVGQEVSNAITALGVPLQGPADNHDIGHLNRSPLGQVLLNYERSLQAVKQSIGPALQEKSRNRYEDLDLWKPVDQESAPIWGKLGKTIPLCSKKLHGFDVKMSTDISKANAEDTQHYKDDFNKVPKDFAIPSDLARAIPPLARTAYKLKLGNHDLRACVSSIGFEDARDCASDDPKTQYRYRWCNRLTVRIDGFSGARRIFTWTLKGPEFERAVRTADFKRATEVPHGAGGQVKVKIEGKGRLHTHYHLYAVEEFWPQMKTLSFDTPELTHYNPHGKALEELRKDIEAKVPSIQEKLAMEVNESLSADGLSKILGNHLFDLKSNHTLLLAMLFYTQGKSILYSDEFRFAVMNQEMGLISPRQVLEALRHNPGALATLQNEEAGAEARNFIRYSILRDFDGISYSQAHPWVDPTLNNLRSFREHLQASRPKLSVGQVLDKFWSWVNLNLGVPTTR